MVGEVLRFAVWLVVIVFILDFVYSAFNQGRHLNQAFKPHRRRRNR
jgi:hypothetical protein